MSNESYEDISVRADERPVRLPRDGGSLWKTVAFVVLAASAAAGAITFGIPRATQTTTAPAPKPEETPGVQAPAPAPRIVVPEQPPEQPKMQERVGIEPTPATPQSGAGSLTAPRTAPFQISPDSMGGGPRQIPLTPRVVQTTPITAPPPLSALPAEEPANAPTSAPLPKARPR